MKLDCILDTCPNDGKPVDMRKCCKPCEFYGAELWSETGEVTCNHPDAIKGWYRSLDSCGITQKRENHENINGTTCR